MTLFPILEFTEQPFTNDDRAERGKYAALSVREDDETDPKTLMVDVLTDFMHWCDREHLDFYRLIDLAEHNYDAEATEA